jgi:hypothetical protein
MTITLNTTMANGNSLFLASANPSSPQFTQLHMDVINRIATANPNDPRVQFYQWASTNNIQIRIGDGTQAGTVFNTQPEIGDAPHIRIDPKDFTAATDLNADAATNLLRNAAYIVVSGVHEVRHAQDNADGTPIPGTDGYANPAEYANARAHAEGRSTAAEGLIDQSLIGQQFVINGQTVTYTQSTYAAGGSLEDDAQLHNILNLRVNSWQVQRRLAQVAIFQHHRRTNLAAHTFNKTSEITLHVGLACQKTVSQ